MQRRNFLKAIGAASVIGMTGTGLLFAPPATAAADTHDTIVHLFVRGGMDGLSLLLPTTGDDRWFYQQLRGQQAVPVSGGYAAFPLFDSHRQDTGFGLHPVAGGLHDLWQDRQLAVVQATGNTALAERSHFAAQRLIENGVARGSQGWMTRAWLASPAALRHVPMPSLGVASALPQMLVGLDQGLSIEQPDYFRLDTGAVHWRSQALADLSRMWQTSTASPRCAAGQNALDALDLVGRLGYAPLPSSWPDSQLARRLWSVAQSIRFEVGLRYATVDFGSSVELGGWDTHGNQGTFGPGKQRLQDHFRQLSEAVAAFMLQLQRDGTLPRVTLFVHSEFGRRVALNGSDGTDHGQGNAMLVIGGPVNGGRLYGRWPGLDPDTLASAHGDIPVTTDFRQVFSEALIARMGIRDPAQVFPGYHGYRPLGLFNAVAGSV